MPAQALAKKPGELSSAVQQCVAIAPTLVLAEEPTANPDRSSADQVFALMCHVHRRVGTSSLIVTHYHLLTSDLTIRLIWWPGR